MLLRHSKTSDGTENKHQAAYCPGAGHIQATSCSRPHKNVRKWTVSPRSGFASQSLARNKSVNLRGNWPLALRMLLPVAWTSPSPIN
jgi:hypothetical protein